MLTCCCVEKPLANMPLLLHSPEEDTETVECCEKCRCTRCALQAAAAAARAIDPESSLRRFSSSRALIETGPSSSSSSSSRRSALGPGAAASLVRSRASG